jgi:Protein of unknown function (DUF3822)
LNPTFKIESAETEAENTKLVLLPGPDTFSFIISGAENNFLSLQSYQLPAETNADIAAARLKEIISSQDVLRQNFERVVVIYCFPSALIVPDEFAAENNKKEMLELIFGDQHDSLIKTDTDTVQNRQVVYSTDKQTASVINYIFPVHTDKHLYSLLPGIADLHTNELYCIFFNNSFTVLLLKEGKLQLVQTYCYKSPEDVVYYLLHLCESFDVEVNTVTVHLNGMISRDSSLYNEISKYFLEIKFGSLPSGGTYPEAIHEYPDHFFSYLFALLQCV